MRVWAKRAPQKNLGPLIISTTVEDSVFQIWYTTWVQGVECQKQFLRSKFAGVWAMGAPPNFGTPYLFLQELKLATSNLD